MVLRNTTAMHGHISSATPTGATTTASHPLPSDRPGLPQAPPRKRRGHSLSQSRATVHGTEFDRGKVVYFSMITSLLQICILPYLFLSFSMLFEWQICKLII